MHSMPTPHGGAPDRPRIRSAELHEAFLQQVRAVGMNPDDPWVRDYVDYEWSHLRPWLAAYGIELAGREVLELGCNIGASSVVMAALGARVRGVDIDPAVVDVAASNARRYGLDHAAGFACVADTRDLPFAAAGFDVVLCNSVLEYVQPGQLAAVQREADRVLKPGGLLLVTGTSSRLWPKEVHTDRWFTNYVPRALDGLLFGGRSPMRGVWPWTMRYGFGAGYRNLDARDRGAAFLAARAAMDPPMDSAMHRFGARLGALLGIGPGLLMRNISCVLGKSG